MKTNLEAKYPSGFILEDYFIDLREKPKRVFSEIKLQDFVNTYPRTSNTATIPKRGEKCGHVKPRKPRGVKNGNH